MEEGICYCEKCSVKWSLADKDDEWSEEAILCFFCREYAPCNIRRPAAVPQPPIGA